uniref:C-type lectin domain-containing protein n=1 Tax=Ficedula albicollis TaxID=59894 RepID=A0A803WB17_FICAL
FSATSTSVPLTILLRICQGIVFCLFPANPSPAKDLPECPPLELCPSGWLYFQRKCYYLSEREDAWNSSQSHCSSHNASLLVIENHQELSFMMKITKQDPWIGLSKRNEEFFWVNGKALDNELFEVKGSGSCAYLEPKGVSASGCYLTRKWVCSLGSLQHLEKSFPCPIFPATAQL